MSALLIQLDDRTARQLETMSRSEGVGTEDFAAKLLRRAILQARPRRTFDADAVRQANQPFEAEDLALADSDVDQRSQLLAEEDRA
jgi:hypothetical protein